MRTITIHVPNDTYRAFQAHAVETGTSASELIRRAMEAYHRQHIQRPTSVFDNEPADAGRLVRPLSADDDLLGEMLE
jgi:predicted transcriptional regulator